jgi:tetratricopeptide (TPR) repeat protein
MNQLLRQRIEQGRVVLFLGAGASKGCTTAEGKDAAPLGGEMKLDLCKLSALSDSEDDDLQDVFRASQRILGRTLQAYLDDQYSRLRPSPGLVELAKYHWARVYTTNIDDAFYTALTDRSPQRVSLRSRLSDAAPVGDHLSDLDLVFLNGYVRRPNDGYLFTAQEYARAQAANLPWFRQLVRDFHDFTFLFIGTRLKEPTFNFHLATHAQTATASIGRSLLVLPSMSLAQKESLSDMNLEHIPGTLTDLTGWLASEFPNGLSSQDILTARNPILAFFRDRRPSAADLEALDAVELVSRSTLPPARPPADLTSSSVDFYKGFKPTWSDITSAIPAKLQIVNRLTQEALDPQKKVIVLWGAMGSGKTTTLMQCALALADAGNSVYYLRTGTDSLRAIIDNLEKAHTRYYLFIERASRVDRQLRRCLSEECIRNGTIICGEREKVWNNQVQELLANFAPMGIAQPDLNDEDADLILEKIKQFAPAVGLTGLSGKERRKLLLQYAKRQLLVGLLTATYGLGYKQMILAEFEGLGAEARACLLLVGLATQHDIPMPRRVVDAALREHYGKELSVDRLLPELTGIVRDEGYRLYARHPVYISEILRSRVVRDQAESALTALLKFFATLPQPISAHRDRLGLQLVDLFKKTVNHTLVSFVLRDPERILAFYRGFERAFSSDGLFWLQMGLSYRGVGRHPEALEALESAYRIHPMTHTQHALAQQKIVIASKLALTNQAEKARAFLDEGMTTLRYLDSLDNLQGGRYYPIVALSEGHVFITKILDGDDVARPLASKYAEIIVERLAREGAVFRGTVYQRLNAPQVRAKKALQRLTRYTLEGRWEFGSDLAPIMTTDLPDTRVY